MRTAEKRFITVRLSKFAREALAVERGQDGRVQSQVVRAIRCYLNEKGPGGRPGWAYPAFLRNRKPPRGEELRLQIEDSLWRSLEEEAESQGVAVQRLLEHAVLYFAGEVDAGRLTERILDDLKDE